MYRIEYTRQAKQDAKKLRSSNLEKKTRELIDIIKKDPFTRIPPFEALAFDLKGCYSRRINREHRLVYTVLKDKTG